PEGTPAASAPADAAAAPGLRVRVRLAPALAARAAAGGTVFVMARDPEGPPTPVAAERHDVAALPLETVLDDRDSPMPTPSLSRLAPVVVPARLSPGCTTYRWPGDLEPAAARLVL